MTKWVLKIWSCNSEFSGGSFESNNLQDIIDIQKLKSDLPLAMKLYYSERTAIINPLKSVKNVTIKVAKKIWMYKHYMFYATSLQFQDTLVVKYIPRLDS